MSPWTMYFLGVATSPALGLGMFVAYLGKQAYLKVRNFL